MSHNGYTECLQPLIWRTVAGQMRRCATQFRRRESLDKDANVMNRFAALFNAIDPKHPKTTVKVAALADYFSAAPE